MDLTEYKTASSLATAVEASLMKSKKYINSTSRNVQEKANTLRSRISVRIEKNKKHVKNLSSFIQSWDEDLDMLQNMRREITFDPTSKISEGLSKLQTITNIALKGMEEECARSHKQIEILNGIKEWENTHSDLKHLQEDTVTHYRTLAEDYKVNYVEKHNRKFEICAQEADEMVQNAKQIMLDLAKKLEAKNQQLKSLKHDVSKQESKLDQMYEARRELETEIEKLVSRQKASKRHSGGLNSEKLRIAKDVNRLMTQRLDLQKVEKKLREQIRLMNSNCAQLTQEMEVHSNDIHHIKRNLAKKSTSFNENRRLSESVDLNQSKLECFLNQSKETKKELLTEINSKKQKINRYRTINKSFSSRRFISSDFDAESRQSEDSQIANFDFVDLTNQELQNAVDKEFVKSLGGSTAENATMATKRSRNSNSEFDSKSLNEK